MNVQISARHLAQLRMVASKAKLKPGLAEAFADGAASRGLTVAQAEAALPGVILMASNTVRKLEDAATIKLVDDFLSELTGGPQDPANPADPTALASQILLSHLAAEDDRTQINTRNSPVNMGGAVGHSWDSPAALVDKIADARAAALAPRMGLKHEATIGRDLGPDSLAHARVWAKGNGLRMSSDAETMAAFVTGRAAGRVAYMSGAHTSSDFPTIAGSTVQILIGRALEQAPVGLATCAQQITAADYRSRKMANTSAASSLQKVGEGGEVKYRTIDDTGETVPAVDRYAGAFTATAELLANASAGGYELETAISRALLAAAQEAQRTVLAAAITANAILSDGNAVFSAAHGNVAGAASAVTVASVAAARVAMNRFVDTRGAMRPVVPQILLVPPEKQLEAEQVLTAIMATKFSDANPFPQTSLRIVVDPGLSGTGTYYWFVAPDPGAADGLALVTLDGMATPQVEVRDAWPNFGMTWRVQWPLAAAFVRSSWYRTQGA